MNIKITSEKTGLTKRAIKYYESQGLIISSIHYENNYREYSGEDIIKLNLIGALRVLDIPIVEIKKVIDGNKNMQQIMREALYRVDKDINNLKKSRIIISNMLEKNLENYNSDGENIKKLRESLELSIDGKKEFISSILRRIFPGNYGEAFILSYEPFLNITIDNDEKEKLWIKIVELLDDFNDLSETEEASSLINKYNKLDEDTYTEEFRKKRIDSTYKIINWDAEYIDGNIKRTVEKWKQLLDNTKEMEEYKTITMPLLNDMANTFGAVQNQFGKYLEILNDEYNKYMNNIDKISIKVSEQLEKETGLTTADIMNKINL